MTPLAYPMVYGPNPAPNQLYVFGNIRVVFIDQDIGRDIALT